MFEYMESRSQGKDSDTAEADVRLPRAEFIVLGRWGVPRVRQARRRGSTWSRRTLSGWTGNSDNIAAATGNGTGGSRALGGGIYFVALAGSSKISITGSAISDNKAVVVGTGGGPDFVGGGGLLTTTSGGTVDHVLISGSKLLDNVLHAQTETNVTAYGGGLATSTQSGLTVKSSRIDGSRFSILSAQDASASGGGIYEEGPASVTSSSISSGSIDEHAYTNAFASGGGIDEEGTGALAVTTSTVDENKVTELSDTALATGGGGGIHSTGSLTLTRSTISRNSISATTDGSNVGGGVGGGLDLEGQPNTIANSTITGNAVVGTSTGATGYGNASGGGINVGQNMSASFVSSTVARNTLKGSGNTVNLTGGGVLGVSGSTISLKAAILGLDTAGAAHSDLACFGTVTSSGHSLIQKISGCSFSPDSTDKVGANPKLASLAENGGPTETLALLKGSPAIDAIPAAACPETIDQRGVSRPQGHGCDIGSFELKS
jgi:hypothetical protein